MKSLKCYSRSIDQNSKFTLLNYRNILKAAARAGFLALILCVFSLAGKAFADPKTNSSEDFWSGLSSQILIFHPESAMGIKWMHDSQTDQVLFEVCDFYRGKNRLERCKPISDGWLQREDVARALTGQRLWEQKWEQEWAHLEENVRDAENQGWRETISASFVDLFPSLRALQKILFSDDTESFRENSLGLQEIRQVRTQLPAEIKKVLFLTAQERRHLPPRTLRIRRQETLDLIVEGLESLLSNPVKPQPVTETHPGQALW